MTTSLADQNLAQLGGPYSILTRQKRDHIELERLLHRIDATTGAERQNYLTELCRLVFPHAFAEESVLWPAIRKMVPGGEPLTLEIEKEHQEINELFAELEKVPEDDPRYPQLWEHIKSLLREDVRDEEDRLLPMLQDVVDRRTLIQLGWAWEAVRRTAPTRPHPVVARRPPGNVVAAAPLTVLDRARDHLDRGARRSSGRAKGVFASASAGLARVAGMVEHVPPLTHGEGSEHELAAPTRDEFVSGIPAWKVAWERRKNSRKAQREGEAGPARKAPDATPIGEAIEHFHDRGDLSLGIPAHRSGTGRHDPVAARWVGSQAFRADIGMNNGVDNRHQSWQVEPTAMELFAEAVGADQTLFSTNGSTENVHVAMMAAVRPGETLVMARNGHKSAFSGLVLSGAMPVYVDPDYDHRWQVAHGVDPASLRQTLAEHPDAAAAMVFTPSYYGVSSDVRALADAAHGHGIPLVTDDAWGLDYSFCSRLPPSALESGADLCIGSVHKTLNGLLQTSVLSAKGDRIDTTRLSMVFELTQSTSASSLLLSSIDAARRQFQEHGEDMLGNAIDLAERIRSAVTGIPGLDLMGEDVLRHPGAMALDPTHVTVDVIGLGLTGYQAGDWLRERCGIHVELADHRRIMALITFADSESEADRFVEALTELAGAHEGREPLDLGERPVLDELRTETVMLPRDAYLGHTEMVSWRKAAGRLSAEMICPYPPGIPIVAPGELITDAIVDYLERQAAAGVMVEGAADESLAEMRVVAR